MSYCVLWVVCSVLVDRERVIYGLCAEKERRTEQMDAMRGRGQGDARGKSFFLANVKKVTTDELQAHREVAKILYRRYVNFVPSITLT